jgi:hypothetical protein
LGPSFCSSSAYWVLSAHFFVSTTSYVSLG